MTIVNELLYAYIIFNRLFYQIKRYMRSHVDSSYTLMDVAEYMQMNPAKSDIGTVFNNLLIELPAVFRPCHHLNPQLVPCNGILDSVENHPWNTMGRFRKSDLGTGFFWTLIFPRRFFFTPSPIFCCSLWWRMPLSMVWVPCPSLLSMVTDAFSL